MNTVTFFSAVDGVGGALSRWWLAAGWTMLHFLWLGAAFGLAAWLVRRVLRPFGPQVCYVALLLMLFGMAAGAVRLYAWLLERMPAPVSISVAAPVTPAVTVEQPTAAVQATAPAPPVPGVTPADALQQEGLRWLGEAAQYVPWLWLIGSPATLLFLALGLAGAERLRRHSRLLDAGDVADTARRLAVGMRVTRNISVAVCDRVVAPMLLGILRPLIVLPPAVLAGHSATQIEMILIHELAHIRRWDNLVNFAQRIVEALLFFHPAVWIVSRWVRLEREHCCDAVVLAHTGDPQAYAETLAALAIPGLAPAHAAAAMANHQLVTRIRQILNIEERSMTVSSKMLSVVGSIIVVTGLFVAAYAQSKPPEPAPDAKADAEKPSSPIDRHVLGRLISQRVLDNKDVDDATFCRRLMLDLTGTLPTPEDIKGFVDDKSPEKRQKLVDRLLASEKYNQDYATYVGNILLAQQAFSRADLVNQNTLAITDQPAEVLLSDVLTVSTPAAKRPYSAEQLVGPPDATMGGNSESAWCSLSADDQEEWLELEYAEPVYAVAVLVYENTSPGAVSQVQVHSAEQPGLSFTWADRDPTANTVTHGVSVIPLATQMKTKRIKITLDSKNTPGWNEIDAVGLLDQQGKVHWAASAKASSTYADAPSHTAATVTLRSSGDATVQRLWPMVGRAVQQGDVLVTLSDAQPKQWCYVIVQQEQGQDRVVRYTLGGKETVLDVLAKVYPDARLAERRVWVLRPAVGDNGIDQILYVDREAAVRRGDAKTNYQVQSGDRIFVGAASPESKADPKSQGAVRRGARWLTKPQETPRDALSNWIVGSNAERPSDAKPGALTQNSNQGQTGTLSEPQRPGQDAVERQRLTAEAQKAAALMAQAEAESKKLQAMLQQQQALIKSLRDQVDRLNLSPDMKPRPTPPNSAAPPLPSQPGNVPQNPALPAETPPAKPAQLRVEGTPLQADQIELVRRWIGAGGDAGRSPGGKPENEVARATVKALLGQSATVGFSGVKQLQRVAVDAEEVAFASTAKPNEVIVCGKRVGRTQIRAYDADGKLYLVEVEFVEPQPPKPGPEQ